MADDGTGPDGWLEAGLRTLAAGASPCPDVSALQSGASGELADHARVCIRCSEILAAAREPGVTVAEDRIEAAVARLAARIGGLPTLLRLVVRAVGERLRVLDLVGQPVAAMPTRAGDLEAVVVAARREALRVVTHVAATTGGRFSVQVDVTGRAGGDAITRVTLTRSGRELASLEPRHGRLTFGGLRPGAYRILLGHGPRAVGALDLELEAADEVR